MPISAHELFSFWLDLSDPPSRHFCGVIGHFMTGVEGREMQAQKLIEYASKTSEGKSEYFGYCVRERRSILEVFADFGVTNQVPLPYLIQGIGRQKQREFSISSAANGKSCDLTMAVVKYETRLKRQISGVCSGWLAGAEPQTVVPVWWCKGTMKFPEDRPLILVGPGTGVAAFRAAIQQSFLRKCKQKIVLVFGCRDEKKDFYYCQEWKDLQS